MNDALLSARSYFVKYIEIINMKFKIRIDAIYF